MAAGQEGFCFPILRSLVAMTDEALDGCGGHD